MRLFLSLAALAFALPALAADPPKHPGHRVLAQDKGHVAIIGLDGKIEWEVDCKYNSHDIALLPNGNLLLHTAAATVTEMTPKKEVVWKYEAKPKEGYKGHRGSRVPAARGRQHAGRGVWQQAPRGG